QPDRLVDEAVSGVQEQTDIGATEAVDRLLRVTDEEETWIVHNDVLPPFRHGSGARSEEDGELDLDRVGVLELVDQQPGVATVKRRTCGLAVSQQLPREHQQVVELEPTLP